MTQSKPHLLAFMVVVDTNTQEPIYMGTIDKNSAVTVLTHLIAQEQAEAILKAQEEKKGKKSEQKRK